MEQKHSSKQVIPITYTHKVWSCYIRFGAAVTFEGLLIASLWREYKNMQYYLVYMSSLYISIEKNTT